MSLTSYRLVPRLLKTRLIKYKLVLLSTVGIVYIFYLLSRSDTNVKFSNSYLDFYLNRSSPTLINDTRMLENILTARVQPKNDGTSIFFIESNRTDDLVLKLNARQACSIEAAGKGSFKSYITQGRSDQKLCFEL